MACQHYELLNFPRKGGQDSVYGVEHFNMGKNPKSKQSIALTRRMGLENPFVLLRTILGLQQQELGSEILGDTMTNLKAGSVIADCQRGKNSLGNNIEALQNITLRFGLRPECLIPYRSQPTAFRALRGVSQDGYTPIWFLAWTYAGQDNSSVGRLQLARRTEYAAWLHTSFVRSHDPLGVEFADYHQFEEYGRGDDNGYGTEFWWQGLKLEQGQSLFQERYRLATELFESLPHPRALRDSLTGTSAWLNELQILTDRFNLLPIFYALEGERFPF